MFEKVIHVYLNYPKYKNEENRRKLMKIMCSVVAQVGNEVQDALNYFKT